MIQIEGLHFAWPDGRQIFSGLSLTLPEESVTALVGPHGTGKTTLLRLIAWLERPLRGRIGIAGQDTSAGLEMAQPIGAVMQNSDRHFLHNTAFDEVAVAPRILKLEDPRHVTMQALERLGLTALATRHPLDLDASARRLVSLASAIAHRPKILLLDEVQHGLDRLHRNSHEAAILAEAERGASVVLVSHDVDFIRRTAGRLIDLTAENGLRE